MKLQNSSLETQPCFQECRTSIQGIADFLGNHFSKTLVEVFPFAKRIFNRTLFLFLVHQKHPLWETLEGISTREVYDCWNKNFSEKTGLLDSLEDVRFLNEGFLALPNEVFWSSSSDLGIFNILMKQNFGLNEEYKRVISPLLLEKLHEAIREIHQRKESGTFYTPPELVRSMCRLSLMQHFERQSERWSERFESFPLISRHEWSHLFYGKSSAKTLSCGHFFSQWPDLAKALDESLEAIRVIDLSMGSGGFLIGIFEEIVALRSALTPWIPQAQHSERALFSLKKASLEQNLYGIDIDAGGIEVCHFRLWLSFLDETGAMITSIPENNELRLACGNALQLEPPPSPNLPQPPPKGDSKGGFDLVLGNPPYLKEREHFDIFQAVKRSSFGKKYHEGKMDFWFYFLHQAMNILGSTGSICYVTPRYWLNSRGAKKLIQRIQKELTIVHILDLGNQKIFPGVSGHHLVALYTSGKKKDEFCYQKLSSSSIEFLNDMEEMKKATVTLKNSDVFTATHELVLSPAYFSTHDTLELGTICHISQGVIEAPDKIRMSPLGGGRGRSQGVFVVTQEELEALSLSPEERAICYPYLEPKEIQKYGVEPKRKQFLIYADQENKRKIETHPNFFHLKQHLDQWKPFITSSNKPYGLHRPRCLSRFRQAKLIFKNMFIQNCCAYDEQGYMVGLSTCILIEQNPEYHLKYILAILNSSLAKRWFYHYGKYRGAGVDIGVLKLRQFPIKILSRSAQEIFVQYVNKILQLKYSGHETEDVEQQLDKEIEALYS